MKNILIIRNQTNDLSVMELAMLLFVYGKYICAKIQENVASTFQTKILNRRKKFNPLIIQVSIFILKKNMISSTISA